MGIGGRCRDGSKLNPNTATPQHRNTGSGRLVIFSGPSGVGKDTVLAAWHRANPRVERVVSYATRKPRSVEADGVDYHFVSKQRFEELASDGAFLEHKEVHGNCYATPLAEMEAMLIAGKIAVLKIDVQGAVDVMRLRPDALSIFLLPPSLEDLEKRLRSRGSEADADVERRLKNARWELSFADKYTARVVNDDIDRVVRELNDLV
ncbi:MAG: guanylate kinase [Fimbriimonadaceae bacterium]|nr:guanylate kinase [Fimbriimonadaceae bacterium]